MREPPLPHGTIDTHFHLFGPARDFPYAAGRDYTPPDATMEQYLSLARGLGFSRGVIVQPSVYGTDNSRTLSALEEPPMPMRGVVVVGDTISRPELERMHRLGVRGIRINLLFGAGAEFETARRLAPRLRDMGWHIQFLVDISRFGDIRKRVEALAIPTVFDHFGHVPASRAAGDPGFNALLELLRDGLSWVKLSGAYRVTSETAAPYGDVAPLASALIAANPDRVVWATDWPHPAIRVPMPDDAVLARMAMGWVPDAATRQRLFVTNAERLYGFEPLPDQTSQ
jgi:2-pyrone-4,6-dicarboxylate lactonase